MARVDLSYQPRLISEAEAARYLGISVTNLRSRSIPRRMLGERRLYDRIDLDAFASGLPYEGDSETGANTCDEILKGML